MATMLVLFAVMAVGITVCGLLEETVPAKVWDTLEHILKFD